MSLGELKQYIDFLQGIVKGFEEGNYSHIPEQFSIKRIDTRQGFLDLVYDASTSTDILLANVLYNLSKEDISNQ